MKLVQTLFVAAIALAPRVGFAADDRCDALAISVVSAMIKITDQPAQVTLQIAASEQIGNNGGIVLTSGSFNFSGSGRNDLVSSRNCVTFTDSSPVLVLNTLPLPPEKRNEKVKVLSVAPLFGEAIHRANNDLSITSLFD